MSIRHAAESQSRRKRRNKRIVRARKLIVGTCMVLAIFSIAVPHLIQARGERLVTLVSGSMQPTYMTGATIRITPVEDLTAPLGVGDAITFAGANGTLITHRIIELVTLPSTPMLHYRTQGDANKKPDPFITPAANVIGKVEGNLAAWEAFAFDLQSPIPRAILLIVPLISLIITESMAMFRMILKSKADLSTAQGASGAVATGA